MTWLDIFGQRTGKGLLTDWIMHLPNVWPVHTPVRPVFQCIMQLKCIYILLRGQTVYRVEELNISHTEWTLMPVLWMDTEYCIEITGQTLSQTIGEKKINSKKKKKFCHKMYYLFYFISKLLIYFKFDINMKIQSESENVFLIIVFILKKAFRKRKVMISKFQILLKININL